MNIKCSHCWQEMDSEIENCSVCGIRREIPLPDLTKEEQKTRYFIRALRVLAVLMIVNGVGYLLLGLPFIVNHLMTDQLDSYDMAIIISLPPAVFGMVFGFFLWKFRRWTYIGGIALFAVGILGSIYYMNWFSGILNLLMLYYVANPVSKRLLWRRITPTAPDFG